MGNRSDEEGKLNTFMVMSIPLLELLPALSSPQRDSDEGNLSPSAFSKAPEDLPAVVHEQEHPVYKNISEEVGNGRK